MAKTRTATVTKKNSFISRFLNSVGGIFIGLAVVIICLIALGCNEGRSVKAIRAYDEFGKNLVETGSAQVNPANNGRLVAIRGHLSYSNVSDPAYRVTAPSFVLERYVEMYQYQERKQGSNTDAQITYTYSGVWSDSPIDSSRFQDRLMINKPWPQDGAFQSGRVYADDAKLGDFRVTPEQLRNLGVDIVLAVPDSAAIPAGFRRSADTMYIHNGDLADPEIGDIRVSFRSSEVTRASMLGQQAGDAIVRYTAKNGTQIDRIFAGEKSGAEMVGQLQAENKGVTWLLRILLTALVCAGFAMMLTPLEVLLSMIPFLGKFLGKATKKVAQVIGSITGIALSLLIMAVSWIFVRPLIGIPLLLVTAGLIFLLVRYRKSKVVDAPQESVEPAPAG